ncbi:MAG: endolytic transglycosylase MltG [bacterium]
MKIIKLFITLFILTMLVILPVYFVVKKYRDRPQPQSIVPREEIDITIIPGWDLRQIAGDWKTKGLIKNEQELYEIVGKPAYNYAIFKEKAPILNFTDNLGKDLFPLLSTRPNYVSYEGYFFPDTYRIYKDSELHEVLEKVFSNLENKITQEMRVEINKQGRNLFQVLNMSALVEREAQSAEDMAMVADIFWRRLKQNWALQSCASVNYVTGKKTPGISAEDQQLDTPYNTYLYPGLPLGPVGNPGITAIKATIYPEKNNYWYFMTGNDGQMRYAITLDQHNTNVYNYLR